MCPRCLVVEAGLVDYQSGLALQNEARLLVEQGVWDGVLLLLEHDPVITVGTGGNRSHITDDISRLEQAGVSIVDTNRGGAVTCHNPGQLVGYPVLNLREWRQDVHWYVEQLEELIIRTLARCGLAAGRKARYTGVWLGDQKIAAIGVAVKKWITGHGFSLNINNDLALFNTIVPCGIREFGVTSMGKAGVTAHVAQLLPIVTEEFSNVFLCDLIKQNTVFLAGDNE